MPEFFNPTPEARQALDKLVDEIPGIQQKLVANHKSLQHADRGAHQQQLAGGKVTLEVSAELPAALNGLGIFRPSARHVGIGRISTGLGCPHLETDPDFLGLMAAFRTPEGRRVDFITINDPTSPTDTPAEFIALLKATADAAGTEAPLGNVGSLDAGNVFASQARLLVSLVRHARTRAPAIATHVIAQTLRTVRSSSAYQPYWTGIVRARDVLGKFTFVPTSEVNTARPIAPGQKHLSTDWRERQRAGALDFRLFWIPFVNERTTPLKELTRSWAQDHRVEVGMVSFPKIDPDSRSAKLAAILASEMGANQGNWIETSEGPAPALPATEFTAARFLVYQRSQKERNVLPEEMYDSFFERGEIRRKLADELLRRYNAKRAAGHDAPDVGEVPQR